VVVEPVPRSAGHVSLIAPPSTLWPAVRPGVRTLATGSGELRHSEILLEQGSLALAEARLAKVAASEQRRRLLARLAKLTKVKARRLLEFGTDPFAESSGAVNPAAQVTPTAR